MFDDILLFVRLVDTGSITKLAHHLGINKSTLSKQIIRLEENLDRQILIRHSNSYELTQYGRALYNHFRKADSYLQTCLKKAEQEHSSHIGVVKILCTQFMMRTILKNSFQQINNNYPDINLELQTFTNIKDYNDDFDLAFTYVKPHDPDLLVRKLFSIPMVLMASSELAQKVRDINTPEELFKQYRDKIIWRTKDSKAVKHIIATEVSTGINHYIEFNPQITIKNAMRTDEVFLNDFIRNVGIEQNRAEIASGDVELILPEYQFGELEIFMVRKQGEMNSAVKNVLNELIDGFKSYMENLFIQYGELGVSYNQAVFGSLDINKGL